MLSRTPEYRLWISIRSRCYPSPNTSTTEERNNIKMCDRWKNSFKDFLSDVGHKPTDLHKFIRIDTKKDFTPENCTWSINRNKTRSNSRFIRINDEIIYLRDYCDVHNMKYTTAVMRIKRKGDVFNNQNNIVGEA